MSYLTEPTDIQTSTPIHANVNDQALPQRATRAKELDWPSILAAWEKSGQTQRAFCKARGIKPHIFCYYRSKYQSQGKPKQTFAHVKLDRPSLSTPSMHYQLKLPSGAVLCIPQSYEAAHLKPLLVLLGACI